MRTIERSVLLLSLLAAIATGACKGGEPAAAAAPVAAPAVDVSTPVTPPQTIPNGVAVTGPVRAVENVAGAIQGTGVAVTPTTPLAVGNILQVLWRSTYYQGQVLALNPNGTVKIHYVGWSNGWDEDATRDRLKVGPITPVAGAAVAPPPPPPAPAANAPTGSGTPIDATTALTVGQAILVEWNSRWYPSTVVALNPNGTVRIHYVGWADSWDEDAVRTRIHLP